MTIDEHQQRVLGLLDGYEDVVTDGGLPSSFGVMTVPGQTFMTISSLALMVDCRK